MANCPTPHINAYPEDFGETVLMPGDPVRSRFIAENFLENAKLVNNVRGVQGYTGEYKGKRVSVMASGMGIPSISIYSYELFNNFGVKNILRVGSAGAIREDVKLRDIVIGLGAHTDSNVATQFGLRGSIAPLASYPLVEACVAAARVKELPCHVGALYSSDLFYDGGESKDYAKLGALAVEMESAGLYLNAMRAGANALAICTISDQLITGEALTVEERETSFTDMIELALETALKI